MTEAANTRQEALKRGRAKMVKFEPLTKEEKDAVYHSEIERLPGRPRKLSALEYDISTGAASGAGTYRSISNNWYHIEGMSVLADQEVWPLLAKDKEFRDQYEFGWFFDGPPEKGISKEVLPKKTATEQVGRIAKEFGNEAALKAVRGVIEKVEEAESKGQNYTAKRAADFLKFQRRAWAAEQKGKPAPQEKDAIGRLAMAMKKLIIEGEDVGLENEDWLEALEVVRGVLADGDVLEDVSNIL